MKNLKLYTSILSILFLTCCDKNSGGMDPCDNCHTNIFKCKINGVDWKPDCIPDPLFGCNTFMIQYYPLDKFFEISGDNPYNKLGLHFVVRNVETGMKLPIEYDYAVYADYSKKASCISYQLDTTNINCFIIESNNESKRIVKGKFSFSCFNNCLDTVGITDGIFDLSY
ncbi:MAG: hypothetical protein HOP11_11625 [Saprospiraceae bacterium]|nr:hypothetical protein [Saprospiraceae bacterium]